LWGVPQEVIPFLKLTQNIVHYHPDNLDLKNFYTLGWTFPFCLKLSLNISMERRKNLYTG